MNRLGKSAIPHCISSTDWLDDSQGRKMSKSLGNGIDPLEVIDKYGADALRTDTDYRQCPWK